MKLDELNIESWETLQSGGDNISGYKPGYIYHNGIDTGLMLFKDGKGFFHFVIKLEKLPTTKLISPEVNGLELAINSYKITTKGVFTFIDVSCNHVAFLSEFTALVKEIMLRTYDTREDVVSIVNNIISSWIAFWGIKKQGLLSEEEQLGLMGELIVLKYYMKFNPEIALNSWKGPMGFKHDYVFESYSLELKATLKGEHIHIINGVNQLLPLKDKKMFLMSIIASRTNDGISLPGLINDISDKYLFKDAKLLLAFFDLLKEAGYNKLYEEDYNDIRFNVLSSKVFEVNSAFPKIIRDSFVDSIPNEIISLNYTLDLSSIETSINIENLMPL